MIKGYKGFKKDLTCNNFQFKENETFKHEGEVMLCSSGFHFCTNPLDVLNYYDLTESEFAEVESETVDAKNDSDSKCVCKEIKIGVKLGIKGFVNACVEFLLKETKPIDNKAASGDYSQLAASGDSSQLAASGNSSQLAASGNYSQLAASGPSSQLAASGPSSKLAASGPSSKLAASGNSSKLAASGDSSQLAASGHYSQLAASGEYSQLAASGPSSQLAASGHYSKLAASGDYSQLAASGPSSQLAASGHYSIAAGIGIDNMAQGKKGNWIVLAEWIAKNGHYVPVCVKSVKIDGKRIKENTYYKLQNKKFVEVK